MSLLTRCLQNQKDWFVIPFCKLNILWSNVGIFRLLSLIMVQLLNKAGIKSFSLRMESIGNLSIDSYQQQTRMKNYRRRFRFGYKWHWLVENAAVSFHHREINYLFYLDWSLDEKRYSRIWLFAKSRRRPRKDKSIFFKSVNILIKMAFNWFVTSN